MPDDGGAGESGRSAKKDDYLIKRFRKSAIDCSLWIEQQRRPPLGTASSVTPLLEREKNNKTQLITVGNN